MGVILKIYMCLVLILVVIIGYCIIGDYDLYVSKYRYNVITKSNYNHISQLLENEYAIKLKDQYTLNYILEGNSLERPGYSAHQAFNISTVFIHSFTPQVEEEVVKLLGFSTDNHLINNTSQNAFSIMSPAFHWFNGSLLLVCRVWLYRYPVTGFNYFYMQRYDEMLKPKTPSCLLKIPRRLPSDPRLHQVQNKAFVFFNSHGHFGGGRTRWMSFYDIENNKTYSATFMSDEKFYGNQKNWSPLVIGETLYMVHTLDPLAIMKCSLQGNCSFVLRQNTNCSGIHLRGGTPFEHYNKGYYVSFAHSKFTYPRGEENRNGAYYAAHLVVIAIAPFRLVYVSSSIVLPTYVYTRPPIPQKITHNFFFPVSLILESRDSVVVGGHVNDQDSVLIRMRGIRALMEHVMKHNEKKMESHVCAYTDYVRLILTKKTGLLLG